jgi:hypothetical protein
MPNRIKGGAGKCLMNGGFLVWPPRACGRPGAIADFAPCRQAVTELLVPGSERRVAALAGLEARKQFACSRR